jgi:hypothetical protein
VIKKYKVPEIFFFFAVWIVMKNKNNFFYLALSNLFSGTEDKQEDSQVLSQAILAFLEQDKS